MCKLFADDCKIYAVVDLPENTSIIRSDLADLSNWSENGQLLLNAVLKTSRLLKSLKNILCLIRPEKRSIFNPKWSSYQFLFFSDLPLGEMTKCHNLLIINEECVNFKN